MKKTGRFFIVVLLFIWELPQNLLGLFVFAIMKRRRQIIRVEREKYRWFIETPRTGVSLGLFVFWTASGNRFMYLINDCRMHEYGHARQSARIGPLYLLLIGIPSLSRVFYRWWFFKRHKQNWLHYYDGYPENRADNLGGVTDPRRSDFKRRFR